MIKPIETEYRGIRFRSRLEARYAILFDNLGLKWEYEKEGYEIDGEKYLPDFWFPEQRWWIEIKGIRPTEKEQSILYDVAEHTDANAAYIFWGKMLMPDDDDNYPGPAMLVYRSWDEGYCFCICPKCNAIGIQFEGRGARVCRDKCIPDSDRMHNPDAPLLIKAYREAIGARFEYDERK